jgi:hypothetical protein
MDPIGLGFEAYDHFGRFRTAEKGKPVDASGRLVGGGDVGFTGAVELASLLATTPAVEECFVRHSLRYWLGRAEREADACAITEALARLRQQGSYLAMLESLVSSPTFLQRSVK